MSALILALLLAGSRDANVITRQQAERASTAELAKLFLPPEVASRVIRSKLIDWTPIDNQAPRDPLRAIQLHTANQVIGERLCRSEIYHVGLWPPDGRREGSGPETPLHAISVNRRVRIAVAPNCSVRPRHKFAHVQPSTMEFEAGKLLLWLYDARSIARRGNQLSFDLQCRSELEENPCGNDPKSILASLPLEATHIIEAPSKLRPEGWRVSVMPSGPGYLHKYWEALVSESGDTRTVTLTWTFAAPF